MNAVACAGSPDETAQLETAPYYLSHMQAKSIDTQKPHAITAISAVLHVATAEPATHVQHPRKRQADRPLGEEP